MCMSDQLPGKQINLLIGIGTHYSAGSFVRVAPGLQIRRFVRGATAINMIKVTNVC